MQEYQSSRTSDGCTLPLGPGKTASLPCLVPATTNLSCDITATFLVMDVVDLYAMFACLLCIQIRLQSIDKLALRARCCKYKWFIYTRLYIQQSWWGRVC